MDIIFKVTERYVDKSGTELLFPNIEVETFWTNLGEEPEEVIELYHAHGTSEQFHSELKSDMGVERLPSGKFAVNAVILHIAMVAFNALRLIGQTALLFKTDLPYEHNVTRKRLRKVIDDLIRVGARLYFMPVHGGSSCGNRIHGCRSSPRYTKLFVTCKVFQ